MDHPEAESDEIEELRKRCERLEGWNLDLEKRLEAQASEKRQLQIAGVETTRDLQEELRKSDHEKECLKRQIREREFNIRTLEEKLRRAHSNVQEFQKRKYDTVRAGKESSGVFSWSGSNRNSINNLMGGKSDRSPSVDQRGHRKSSSLATTSKASGGEVKAGNSIDSEASNARDAHVQSELAAFFNMDR